MSLDENLFERKKYSGKSYETSLGMSQISQHFTHNDTWWIYVRNNETVVSFFTTYVCSLLWGSWTPESSIPTVSQSRFNWLLIGSWSSGIKKYSGLRKLTVLQRKFRLEQSSVSWADGTIGNWNYFFSYLPDDSTIVELPSEFGVPAQMATSGIVQQFSQAWSRLSSSKVQNLMVILESRRVRSTLGQRA